MPRKILLCKAIRSTGETLSLIKYEKIKDFDDTKENREITRNLFSILNDTLLGDFDERYHKGKKGDVLYYYITDLTNERNKNNLI